MHGLDQDQGVLRLSIDRLEDDETVRDMRDCPGILRD
jgi:hypothetical protein